jgi:vitamin B12 transporter
MAGWNGALGNHLLQANLRHDSNSQFGDKLTHVLGYGYRICRSCAPDASARHLLQGAHPQRSVLRR